MYMYMNCICICICLCININICKCMCTYIYIYMYFHICTCPACTVSIIWLTPKKWTVSWSLVLANGFPNCLRLMLENWGPPNAEAAKSLQQPWREKQQDLETCLWPSNDHHLMRRLPNLTGEMENRPEL